jgi:SM-20-related protein
LLVVEVSHMRRDCSRRPSDSLRGVMASPDLLARLGVFVGEDFLDASMCQSVLLEMRSATGEQAEVYTAENPDQLEEGVRLRQRQAKRVKPAGSARRLLEERLDQLRPRLEEKFGVSLGGFEPPTFLVYGPGDFHQAHHDAEPDAAEEIARRKVSVVVFLNDQSDEPVEGSYGGGSLVFGGLVPGFGDETRGIPVVLSAGSIVGFRSDVLHEVKPVTHGERFTIVSWFY